jgi:hypothetical protein
MSLNQFYYFVNFLRIHTQTILCEEEGKTSHSRATLIVKDKILFNIVLLISIKILKMKVTYKINWIWLNIVHL